MILGSGVDREKGKKFRRNKGLTMYETILTFFFIVL